MRKVEVLSSNVHQNSKRPGILAEEDERADGWMAARPFNGPTDGGTDECGTGERERERQAGDNLDGRGESAPASRLESNGSGGGGVDRGSVGAAEVGRASGRAERRIGRMSASRKSVRSDNAASHAWAPREGKVGVITSDRRRPLGEMIKYQG